MKIFRCGLVEDAWDHPEIDIRRFQAIETKLDENRDYLYANSKAAAGYAGSFRRGERVGTAHVESTVTSSLKHQPLDPQLLYGPLIKAKLTDPTWRVYALRKNDTGHRDRWAGRQLCQDRCASPLYRQRFGPWQRPSRSQARCSSPSLVSTSSRIVDTNRSHHRQWRQTALGRWLQAARIWPVITGVGLLTALLLWAYDKLVQPVPQASRQEL
jgi:hypothetical protein